MTLIVNMAIGLMGRNGGDAGGTLLIPPVMFFAILALSFQFCAITKPRYRGRSLAFLVSAYFFGQIIVCLALWVGSCVLFYPPLRL